jgi:hypothetical protein
MPLVNNVFGNVSGFRDSPMIPSASWLRNNPTDKITRLDALNHSRSVNAAYLSHDPDKQTENA